MGLEAFFYHNRPPRADRRKHNMYYRMILVLPLTVTIGCTTPSDVTLSDARANGVTVSGRYFYTDPMTTMVAGAQMLHNHEEMRAIEAVREAADEAQLQFALKKLEAVKAARPQVPVKVPGTITNYSTRDLICEIFADESRALRLGTVPLPSNSEVTFYLTQGLHALFVFVEGGQEVGTRVLDNPADVGWLAWVK